MFHLNGDNSIHIHVNAKDKRPTTRYIDGCRATPAWRSYLPEHRDWRSSKTADFLRRSPENVTDTNNPHESPSPPSFEQALVQLEQIVRQLEDGEVGLAEALSHYEQGVKLLKQCYGLLERAERRIELVSGVDADGNPITQPFDDESTLALEEKSQSRTRRRSKRAETSQKGGSATPLPTPENQDDIDTLGSLF